MYDCPDENNIGIYHMQWDVLRDKLPNKTLMGSGWRTCKRFEVLEEAREYFHRVRKEEPSKPVTIFK